MIEPKIFVIMKTIAYIFTLLLFASTVVMNYRKNGQPRREECREYNFKYAVASAIFMAILVSLIYWL